MTEQETTETVDTPQWPGPLVTVPALTDIPADSAVDAMGVAGSMLADVLAYREQVAPSLVVGNLPESAFDDVAALRRSVAGVADLLSRRGMLGAAILAQRATRHAERIAGRVVAYAPAGVSPRSVLGDAVRRCLPMVVGSEEDFDRAVEQAADAVDVSNDAVAGLLRSGALDAAERQQRDIMARLVGEGDDVPAVARVLGVSTDRVGALAKRYGIDLPEPVDMAAPGVGEVVPDLLVVLRDAARGADSVASGSIAALDPARAADWSRELWAVLVPLVGLRVALDRRGHQAG